MTFVIDCRMVDASGIGVYIRGCLPCFLDSPHQCLLLGDREKILSLTGERQNTKCIHCTVKPFSPGEIFFFPRSVIKQINRADLFYSPFFNIPPGITVPVYTTIHDIIFPDMPDLVSPPGLALRMFFFRRAYRLSTKLFTVSEFSKSRIEHFLGSAKPLVVTYSAVLPGLSGFPRGSGKSGEKTKKTKTILFIGNIKKHKGLWCLLDAFLRAKAAGLEEKLVIVGSKDKFRSADRGVMKKLDAADSSLVEFTGFISGEELRRRLAEAALLVQPSLYEGFGLPPLEAMLCGTRALISDIPVFKEIYAGFPVVFFRAGDRDDLQKKLMELLYQKEPAPLRLPENLASKYGFQKTAARVMETLSGAEGKGPS